MTDKEYDLLTMQDIKAMIQDGEPLRLHVTGLLSQVKTMGEELKHLRDLRDSTRALAMEEAARWLGTTSSLAFRDVQKELRALAPLPPTLVAVEKTTLAKWASAFSEVDRALADQEILALLREAAKGPR